MEAQRVGSASHPILTRRSALQAGAIGLLGLGTTEVSALRSVARASTVTPKRSVIFVFLTGGIAQHDSFDPKPDAPDNIRGEFRPIATRTPGIDICEHLPLLAQRSHLYALVRSVGTDSDAHEVACHMLLTGRRDLPTGFDRGGPTPNDWPSLPALATYATQPRNNLPPAIVLPQPSINEAGIVRPGQYAGRIGKRWDAWHLNIAANCPLGNGACPECFRFDGSLFRHAADTIFDMSYLRVPDADLGRIGHQVELLRDIEDQQRDFDRFAHVRELDNHRQQAISLLTDPKTRQAFDVERADPRIVESYGKNKFGLSLLMARRLVEAGVNLVQVNLGKNSSWDTHVRNFPTMKDNLLPFADRAIAGLLDDLAASGLLDTTLVIVTGEFGRTPRINANGGRDHWGPVMTMLFAGAGVRGGTVIGASDRLGAYPISAPQTPENFAATIYHTLGIPHDASWVEVDGRPHEIYRGEPIAGLMA